MADLPVEPSENSEPSPATDAPDAEVKKKVTRKRTAKKVAADKAPVGDAAEAPKKKSSRKRAVKKDADEAPASSAESPAPVEKKASDPTPPADAPAQTTSSDAPEKEAKPSSEGSVRRVSVPRDKEGGESTKDSPSGEGNQQAEDGEGGEKKRRRRRRRRGGGGDQPQDGEGDDQPQDDEPDQSRTADGKRPSAKVRQPESRRGQDRKPSNYSENPEKTAAYAWELFKNEVREEGGTLIEDRDARKIAERSFRMAEIFLIEESRTIGG